MTTAKLYLPTAVSKDLHKEVKIDMSKTFGGFSKYMANGGWVNDDNELIEEHVIVYETVNDMTEKQMTVKMNKAASYLADMTDEDVIMFTVNHDPYVVG